MHLVLELLWGVIELILWFFWETVCGWLGSWFLYLVSFGRWNFPNDSVRACLTGLMLLLAAPIGVLWLLD